MSNGYKTGFGILFIACAVAINMLVVMQGDLAATLAYLPMFLLACAISGVFLPHRALVGGLVLLALTIVAALVGVVWYDALWRPLDSNRRFEISTGITIITCALLLFSTGRDIARWRNGRLTNRR